MRKRLMIPPLPDWFSFTKKDRIGLFVLLLLVLILKWMAITYRPNNQWIQPADSAWIQAARALQIEAEDTLHESKQQPIAYAENRQAEKRVPQQLFAFDPNQINLLQWQTLGLSAKTATTILHYRDKGGKFKKPEDIKKIWGIPPALAEQLVPYVRIQQDTFPKWQERKPFPKNSLAVDINVADSAAWERLPGIGPSLAKRIVRFKERLGGFYKIEQVAETFGLPDSTYQRIKPYLKFSTNSIQQIDINTAEQSSLQQHPYIRYALAKVICNYRQQHGRFRSVEDLKQIHLLNDSVFQQLRPYLLVR